MGDAVAGSIPAGTNEHQGRRLVWGYTKSMPQPLPEDNRLVRILMRRRLAITLAIAFCLATPFGRSRTARQYKWWELRRSKSRLVSNIEQALNQLDGSASGSITIARLGVRPGESRVWIGIRGVSDAKSCAQNFANAAGASLGDHCHPPTKSITQRWRRVSLPRPIYAKNNQKRRVQPPTVTVDEIREWVTQVDTHIATGHAIVMTVAPTDDSRFVHVIAATTSKDLAKSWVLGGKTIRVNPYLVPSIVVPLAVAVVTTLLMRSIEVGSLPVGWDVANLSPWIAIPIILLAVFWIAVEVARPRVIHMIRSFSCLPLGVLGRRLGGTVRSTQVAGWARVQNGVQNLQESD